MAEEDAKTEVTKEVLAPAEGPREDLISTAVKFLQNPKVQKSPLQQRKLFLERKGLTKEEIDLAVQRSGVLEKVATTTQGYPPQSQQGVLVQGLHQPPPPQLQQVVPASSRWTGVRDVLSVIALVGGLTYAAYRFYMEILRPFLFGKSKEKDRLDKVESAISELQSTIVATLTKVQETLTLLQDTVSKQDEKIQELKHEAYSNQSSETMLKVQDAQYATEIKSELTSIKGLLLNRRQFPPTPSSTPILPSWQLSASNSAPSSLTEVSNKGSLVTPGGDGGKVSEDAMLNKNEKDEAELESKTEVQYSATSLENAEKPVQANEEEITQDTKSSGETTQMNGITDQSDDEID